MKLQNHTCIKDTFKVQDIPKGFKVKTKNTKIFIRMLSHSTLLLTFKKILLVEFWCNITKENYNYLKGPLT